MGRPPIAQGQGVRYNGPEMLLTTLSLTNFRNFRRLELTLPSGLVVLYGDNAQGKSNLLEAAYLLAIARSQRVTSEREMISWEVAREGGYALVRGEVQHNGGQWDLRLGLECTAEGPAVEEVAVRKRVRVNGVPRRVSELVGLLNAVLFSAEDIGLVYGSPQGRRRYLDVLLSQVSAPYLQALQRYQRVLTQRNHLLRSLRDGRAQAEELLYWDQALGLEGAAILEGRHRALASLAPLAQEAYGQLAGAGEEFVVRYEETAPVEGEPTGEAIRMALGRALEQSRERERALGMTVVGPHRDDLRLSINGMETARYSSRGQARLVALALRLAEGRFLEERRGEAPVLLLDDALSELDDHRRGLVLEEARRYPQTLLTTTDPHSLAPEAWEGAHRLHVEQGQVTEEGGG